MYRRPNRKNELLSEVNVLNLVDVMLCVLIIFILVAPILEQGIAVRLPAASSSRIDTSPESLTVSIAPPGMIYLNDRRITLDELGDRMASAARANPETGVTIRADGTIRYEEVVKVLDAVRNSGLTRIGIATRPAPRER
jgi:biopolymer transport protein ExbD